MNDSPGRRHMAADGWGLVYGGTSIGLMGATTDSEYFLRHCKTARLLIEA